MARTRATPRVTLAAAVVLLLIAAIYLWTFFPLREWVDAFTRWVNGMGVTGVIVFAAAYVVAVVLLLPVWPLSIAGGLAFGMMGIPLVVVSATVGAALAFLVSRYLARQIVRNIAHKRPVLRAIDEAVTDEGWKVVILLRLSPLVPFNLQNYFLGATEIRLLPYVLSTFIGIMPGAAAYVYLGTLGRFATSTEGDNGYTTALLVAGLVATAALVFVVGRAAKEKLERLSGSSGR